MSRNVLGFLVNKIFEMGASLAVLATLMFFMLKVLPGGPFDDDMALNPIVKERLSQHWKIHESSGQQAWSYLQSLVQGDLGVSMIRPDRSVVEIISQGVNNTLALNALALIVILAGSVFVALLSIRYQDSWFEHLVDQGVIAALSLPSLFWGPLLIYIFGFYWNLLPVAFLTSSLHYVLPLVTLCLRPMASLIRLLKNSLRENLKQDYVRTAKAKGLTAWRILLGHVLRNSLIPFLSYGGPLMVSLLSGSFLVEMLFAVPGLGTEFIAAVTDRDYTLIMGLTLFYGALLIFVNSGIEILLNFVDPRLREKA